ncbi:MAG: hypothetical protein U5K69_04600 [Balneolaceae bacterium]|nr:hypothetical protein [Balneolaceae bacterium]
MNRYEKRFIAFIDIIGFKKIIGKSVANDSHISIDSVKEALAFKEPIGKEKLILGGIGDISDSDHRMTTFSDNILISVNNNSKGFFNILNHAERIGFELLKMNFLCRGGITMGKIYHDEQFVFGPGLIRAHELESKKANKPRIIIDKNVMDFKDSLDPTGQKLFRRFTKKDESDGYFFIDTLRTIRFLMQQIYEPPNDVKELVRSIKTHIHNQIEKNRNDPKVLDRLDWFLKYLDDSTNRDFI